MAFDTTIETYNAYAATLTEMTNAEFVADAYAKLLGLEGGFANSAARIDYWVAKLDAGTLTKETFVAQFLLEASTVQGELISDEEFAYNQDITAAIEAADATNTSVEAIETVVADSLPTAGFTIETGLANLATANAAIAAYVEENPDTAGDLAGAQADYDALVGGSDIANDSDALAAALLSDQQSANNTDLVTDQDAQAEALTAVQAIPGLSDALAAAEAAVEAREAAEIAQDLAEVSASAALDAYNINNDTLSAEYIPGEAGEIESIHSSVGDLVVTDEDGNLVLNTDLNDDGDTTTDDIVTEETHPGITALLAEAVSYNSAWFAEVAASDAADAAGALVSRLDTDSPAAADALAAMGAAMLQVTPVNADYPTADEVQQEIDSLTAGVTSLDGDLTAAVTPEDVAALTAAAVTAGYITAVEKDAIDAAADPVAELAASNNALTFQALIDAYDVEAGTVDPLSTALGLAEEDVEASELVIETLDEAIADLAVAEAAADAEAALQADIDAIVDQFIAAGYTAPVTLDGDKTASSESDIFVASTVDSAITNFNLLGEDMLYIGTDFTLNEEGLAEGDNAVLEVFITNVGGNATITLEAETFSSNTDAEETTITLTGVDVADVSLVDGFITVA